MHYYNYNTTSKRADLDFPPYSVADTVSFLEFSNSGVIKLKKFYRLAYDMADFLYQMSFWCYFEVKICNTK